MGGCTIIHDGEWYSFPFDFEFPRSRQKAELPDAVTVTVDERDFSKVLGDDAAWVTGEGPYLVLAYCHQLTITIRAKRGIDGSGCGGNCVGVHLIGFADPENGKAAAREAVVRQYINQHDLKPGLAK